MAEKNKKNNDENQQKSALSDMFNADFMENPPAEELFTSTQGFDFLDGKSTSVNSQKPKKSVLTTFVFIFLLANIAILIGGGAWVYYNLPTILAMISNITSQSSTEQAAAGTEIKQQEIAKTLITEEIYEGAVSFKIAEELFENQQYHNAYLAYKKLLQNLTTNIPSDRYLSDYLHLKMALALNRYNPDSDTSKHFEIATQSLSPFVKALAGYHLAFIQIKSGKYLQARQSIYKTLGLTKCFENFIDETFETDCYFIACESLTRQVLTLNNRPAELPGDGWTTDLKFHSVVPRDQDHFKQILQAGIEKISEGSLIPDISAKDYVHIGTRYSAIAVNAPISEILEKLASTSKLNIMWEATLPADTAKSATINLTQTTPQLIAEITAGAAGLIARFDDPDIIIYNPESYESLENQKDLLSKESIALWRRFLMRYRGDHRSANASFARALMLECDGQTDSAINHYTRTTSQFAHHSLAPYALLNSSNLRTELLDYSGARQDLTQLIMQYRDSKITNQAYLNLAQATMNSGLYEEAIKSFKRLYNTDMSDKLRARAAEGAGMCYYKLEDYKSADEWLINCINFQETVDLDFTTVYFTLGKVKTNLGQYGQAATALKNSLKGNLPTEETVNILIQLAIAQTKQGNLVDALDTIENIATDNLSQELIVDTLATKSYILRNCELPENAISILRHRLAYLSDVNLRAKLSLELALCYSQSSDYHGARDELIEALRDLQPGEIADQVNFQLAQTYLSLENFDKTIEISDQLLESNIDKQTRNDVCKMLGQAYSGIKNYEMAALAFAGKINNKGLPAL